MSHKLEYEQANKKRKKLDKSKVKIIVYSITAAFLIWVIDTIVDFYVLHKSGGLCLRRGFFNIPGETWIRSAVLAVFIVYAVVVANYLVVLRRKEKEARDIAKFPEENPNPVMRVSESGEIIYYNKPAGRLLKLWGIGTDKALPGDVKREITEAFIKNATLYKEIKISDRVFLFAISPLRDAGYANLYGLDITALKETQEDLMDSKRRLSEAQKAGKIGNWEWDSRTGEVFWSEEVYRIFGVSPGEYKPDFEWHIDLVAEQDRKAYRERVERALIDKKRFEHEFKLVTKDKILKYVWLHGDVEVDDSGEAVGMWGIIQDISERKKAENRIRSSEEELKWLLKSMINAFVLFESVFDDKGNFVSYRFVYSNDAYERITGVKNDEVRGKTVHEVWPGTEHEWVEKYGAAAVTGLTQIFDLYHGPTRKYYHCNVYRPWDNSSRFCVVFEDITERREMMERLKEQEALLNKVGNIARIGGWEMDLVTGKSTWTRGTYDIAEIEYDKPIPGYNEHIDFYLPEYREMIRAKMERLVAEKKPMRFEAALRTAKGNVKWCEAFGEAVVVDGKAVKLRGTFQDISERRKTEQMKASLMRDVTHSLKSPISMAKMANDMCARAIEEGNMERVREAQRIACDSISAAMKDITSILDLYTLEQGALAGEKKEVLFEEVIGGVLKDQAHVITRKRLEIKVEVSAGADKIIAIGKQMNILFFNIISNAVKFTDEGSITILTEKTGDSIRMIVKDTGCGIAPEHMGRIFEKFYQRHPAVEGLGLGMAICREIVERSGGSIKVDSEGEGKGATVTVILPAE
ncbi:MAG: PAS domain-containing protein [Candidatus Omnitrophota bacterium]